MPNPMQVTVVRQVPCMQGPPLLLCSSDSFPSLSLFLHIPSFESSFHFLPSISLMGPSYPPALWLPLTAHLTLSRPRNCCVHGLGLILGGWLSRNTLIEDRVPRTGEMKSH